MIAREGIALILTGITVTVILLAGGVRFSSLIMTGLAGIFALLTVFTIYFFRDPDRSVELQPGILVAPADGRILSVEPIEHHDYIGGPATKISIFLSIFDVHINRVPASGVVDFVKFHQGQFFSAFKEEASRSNQRIEIGIITDEGHRIVTKQISGSIARRVICYLQPQDRVVAGNRFGMIRFGSRTELIVPADSRVNVKKGDKVRGGETVIGYLTTPNVDNISDETDKRTNVEL